VQMVELLLTAGADPLLPDTRRRRIRRTNQSERLGGAVGVAGR
jgi:hypothetical protein